MLLLVVYNIIYLSCHSNKALFWGATNVASYLIVMDLIQYLKQVENSEIFCLKAVMAFSHPIIKNYLTKCARLFSQTLII